MRRGNRADAGALRFRPRSCGFLPGRVSDARPATRSRRGWEAALRRSRRRPFLEGRTHPLELRGRVDRGALRCDLEAVQTDPRLQPAELLKSLGLFELTHGKLVEGAQKLVRI